MASPIAPSVSRIVSLASGFYLAHILCEGWIATSEIFLGLSILCAGTAVLQKKLKICLHPLLFPLALFLIASWISALLSPRPGQALLEVGEWFTLLAFPLGLSLYRAHPALLRRALAAFAVLGIFMALYGLLQYFILGYAKLGLEQRITGPSAHVMTYSGILLPVTLMMTALLIDQWRPLYLAAAAAGSLALVLTFTRGIWVGWLAGFAVLLFRRKPRWLLYAVPLLILAIALSPLPVFGRLMSVFDVEQTSNLDRIRMAQAGVEMIRDRPLWGVGPGNVKETYPLYRKPDAPRFNIPHLHNNVVQLWAERGILALAAYLLLIIFFIRSCLKAPPDIERALPEGGVAIAVALFCAGFFEFNFGDTEVLLTMLDWFALIVAGTAVSTPASAFATQAGPEASLSRLNGSATSFVA